VSIATGLGSLPAEVGSGGRGFSPLDFQSRAADGSPAMPYLAEAPQRGAGADMIGRALAIASTQSRDFAATTVPTGWRLSSPGRDMERALAWLGADRDAFCEVVAEHSGAVKVQIAGPYTVAASVENASGARMSSDAAFVAELAQALAAAMGTLISDITRQTAATSVIVQIDEPMVPMVLAGSLPTASGYSRHWPRPAAEVMPLLTQLVSDIAGDVWLHCCADSPPIELLRGTGATGVSIAASAIADIDLDLIGQHIDAGKTLALGVISPADWGRPQAQLIDLAVATSERLRERLSFSEQQWGSALVLTATCGLAGASVLQATAVMSALNTAAASLSGGRITPEHE